jgi:hypothetical protein
MFLRIVDIFLDTDKTPPLNVSTFLEMDMLPHQNVCTNVRDKLKCRLKVPLYLYTHNPSVSLKCLYVYRYTI